MSRRPVACVILAAGLGTRMKSDLPKVLHPVAGVPMLCHVIAATEALDPAHIVVVVGPDMDSVAQAAAPHDVVIQAERLGTGDAVKPALPLLAGFDGDVIVLFGDTPLVRPAALEALLDARDRNDTPAVAVMGMRPDNPGAYGRLVTSSSGDLERIVEAADTTEAERAIGLVNGGIMAIEGRHLESLINAIGNDNAKGEYYLTDVVAIARSRALTCAVAEGSEEDVAGINSRADLARVNGLMQARLRRRALDDGVTLVAPDTVFLSGDTRFGRDVTVEPNVVFGAGVTIGDRVTIRAFSHLDGATVGDDAVVGPFARLRPGAILAERSHVGNFVEVKNAVLGEGAKANHLTYLGDADIGPGTNIGAGTITCNYDGYLKHRTVIGNGVFVGSNTALVAPVSVGDGALIAAGSTITEDVPADSLAIARGRQAVLDGRAARFRERKAAEKLAKLKG